MQSINIDLDLRSILNSEDEIGRTRLEEANPQHIGRSRRLPRHNDIRLSLFLFSVFLKQINSNTISLQWRLMTVADW